MEPISCIAKFYIFLSVIVAKLSTVNCQSFKRDDSRMSYAKFVKNPKTKLNASSLATVKVSSLGECTLECVNHQDCVSVNFGNKDQGRHTCELINTDKFKEPDKLTASQDFHHFNIKTPCMSSPCKNGGTCHPIYENEEYECVCPQEFAGKNCELHNLICSAETLNICDKAMSSWTIESKGHQNAVLSNCDPAKIIKGNELLFIVTRGSINDYGKYEIKKVKEVNGCDVTLTEPFTQSTSGVSHVIVQLFPHYGTVTLSNNCILTCKQQSNGHGGILALRAKTMSIDSTSKITTNSQGFLGGQGGDSRGGGGYGGDSFLYLNTGTNGKGADITGADGWIVNTNAFGSGGAADGPGSQSASGGYNAGGGGADSANDIDDGAGGGGGGGHFSGGGGGGGANSCGHDGGIGGTASSVIGTYAGGGGVAACTGGIGGNGGQPGQAVEGGCSGSVSGAAGTEGSGGGGGGSGCTVHWGGGGGGGGMQFGNTDFAKHLSYGGGGGGGGASAHVDDPHPGGRGGSGGGLVYLLLDELTLDGTIDSRGGAGECLSTKSFRSATGGSGAGGSVVIITKTLHGSPNGKIFVLGGAPVKCAFGVGGGGGGGVGRWVVKTDDSLFTSG